MIKMDILPAVIAIACFLMWLYFLSRYFLQPSKPGGKPSAIISYPDTGSAGQDDLVTVAVLSNFTMAELWRMKLELENIRSIVAGNNFSRRGGGYDLKVRASDAERAINILKEIEQ